MLCPVSFLILKVAKLVVATPNSQARHYTLPTDLQLHVSTLYRLSPETLCG